MIKYSGFNKSKRGIGLAAALAATSAMCAVFIAAPVARAQDYTNSTLTGDVADPSGNPVSGAKVIVRSLDQGFTRSFATDSRGAFRAPILPAGNYQVTIEKQGYQLQRSDNVRVSSGQTSYQFTITPIADGGVEEEIVITAARPRLDFSDNTTGLTIDVEETFARLPIDRSLLAVTLLSPNVVQGGASRNAAFAGQAGIGGASVAENAFYVNGLNITNFNNYIGGAFVPFEFYKTVEVKTGGYQAEFGRATGGIINAVTKSGTNDFAATVSGNFTPNWFRSQAANTFQNRNSLDETATRNLNVEVSGPIIKDHLFFYGLAQYNNNVDRSASITNASYNVDTQRDPFYGFKIDGNITDQQRLEFTFFNTRRSTDRTTFGFDPVGDVIDRSSSTDTAFNFGGISYVARYTGNWTKWLTLSAAYGRSNDRDEVVPGDVSLPFVTSQIGGGDPVRVSPNQPTAQIDAPLTTQRVFYRADADFFFSLFGDHHVRAGFDREDLTLTHIQQSTGGGSYNYFRGSALDTRNITNPNDVYLQRSLFINGGVFGGQNTAYYIQDAWDVTPYFTLQLGVRLDKFAAENGIGEVYSSFNSEFAPRLGFSWDPTRNGKNRLYGSFGQYYLPIPSNTSFRFTSGETFFSEYFRVASTLGAGGVPVVNLDPATGLPAAGLGALITGYDAASICPALATNPGAVACEVTGDGRPNPTESLIARDLLSTRESEYIGGFEHRFNDKLKAGVEFIYRKLDRTAEDVSVDTAVLALCDAEGIVGCDSIYDGFHQYAVINPGRGARIVLSDPLPGETDVRTVDFTAEQLGFPEAQRRYWAATFILDRTFDGKWGLQGSYTVSSLRGNNEGFVKSDNGQDDAGITTSFDLPALTDNSFGFLPGHRRHQIKLFGSYAPIENLTVGGNLRVASPRRFGCLGVHPTDPFAPIYGAESFFCQGLPTPRGTQFKSDWLVQLDVSGRYVVPVNVPGQLILRLDVFNLFNIRGVLDREERGDLGSGGPRATYQRAITAQQPRSLRLGFEWSF